MDDDSHLLTREPAELIEVAEVSRKVPAQGLPPQAASAVSVFQRLARHELVANAAIVGERLVGSAEPVLGERLVGTWSGGPWPRTLRDRPIMVIGECVGVAGRSSRSAAGSTSRLPYPPRRRPNRRRLADGTGGEELRVRILLSHEGVEYPEVTSEAAAS